MECDRYHKWERHNENWKTYTHLNPDANFVSKMQADVFNLKIGNSIFQVDYDHNTGKFKQPEKIENADNIIVCGLHSLYGDAGHIYNFSIYMDPDESLKTKWKLERDVKTRGYTEEKVIKQISDRKTDYKKYVAPQKNNSDIVVNFFAKADMSLGLNILINKKHSVENILSSFSKYNIPYEFKTNEKLYRLAHKNHPVTIWCRKTKENFVWVLDLVDNLHDEWKYRYGHPAHKEHKSYGVARYLRENIPPAAAFERVKTPGIMTPFALAMPDEFKIRTTTTTTTTAPTGTSHGHDIYDAVASYRSYYLSEPKRRIAKWGKLRGMPLWYARGLRKIQGRPAPRLVLVKHLK